MVPGCSDSCRVYLAIVYLSTALACKVWPLHRYGSGEARQHLVLASQTHARQEDQADCANTGRTHGIYSERFSWSSATRRWREGCSRASSPERKRNRSEQGATLTNAKPIEAPSWPRPSPGFRRLVALIDREHGKSIGSSVWDSAAGPTASETSGNYQQRIAELGGVLAGLPGREASRLPGKCSAW